MVSLEYRTNYLEEFSDNNILLLIRSLLFEKEIEIEPNSLLDEIAVEALKIISNDKSESFSEKFSDLSGRKLTISSSYVHNDGLLFLIICALKKLDLNSEWLNNLFSLRIKKSKNAESKITASTLKAILNGEKTDTKTRLALFLIYQKLINQNIEIDLKLVYKELTSETFPIYENPFLNLIALKAYDITIVEGVSFENQREYDILKKFEITFVTRVGLISKFFSYSILLLLLVIPLYLYINLHHEEPLGDV